MKVNDNSEKIVVRHTPLGKWILGGLLALIFGGLFVWLVLSIIFKPHIAFAFGAEIQSDLFLVLLLAAVGATFVILPLICAPQMNVTISQKTKSVDIERRRIYGTKAARYFFYQIRKFKSHKGKTRFSPAYSLALIRANGKVIKLKIPTGDKNATVKFVKKLNKFVKQSPKDELAEYVLFRQNPPS